MTTAPRPSRRLEILVGLVFTAVIVCLHALRALKAGGLWRDEAAAVQLATMSPLREVVSHFQHEAFPLLFPAAVRGVAWLSDDSDVGLRAFGMLVGLAIVGALWWNMWMVRRGVPLLSLALLGFNGAFIQWGDSTRGYGLGTFFILLTVGLFWRVVEHQTPGRIAAATLSAIASVQCHFHNPVLLLAIGLGAAAVTLRCREVRQTALMLAIGAAAAVSLLPYWKPLRDGRDWDILVRSPVTLWDICSRLSGTLSASGWSNTWLWGFLLVSGLAVALRSQFAPKTIHPQRDQKDLLLFSGTALVIGVAGYACFLEFLSYHARPWYFLALMAFVAMLLDFVFDTLQPPRWARAGRLALVLVIACTSLPLVWGQVQMRQSNVDLIAAKLEREAQKDDLIVVSPWHNGISFERYYGGAAPWMTIPPIEFHKFHRYDLIKAQMTLPDQNDPVKPLLRRIRETLKSGHRVWVVGVLASPGPGNPPMNLPPAPDKQWGWQDQVYSLSWSMKIGAYLRSCARHREPVHIEFDGPVNPLENLAVSVFEGWSEP